MSRIVQRVKERRAKLRGVKVEDALLEIFTEEILLVERRVARLEALLFVAAVVVTAFVVWGWRIGQP